MEKMMRIFLFLGELKGIGGSEKWMFLDSVRR
jgi:hypothetical protein